MEINYTIVIPVILVVLIFIGWLIWRNTKDEKKFEKELNSPEVDPDEKHQEKI